MTNAQKSKGGIARAKALSAKRKKEIAREGGLARWYGNPPVADYEGTFNISDNEVTCAVLPGGKRIITQAAFLRALGRSRSPKAGTGVLSTAEGLPFFLQAKVLQPFISNELKQSSAPVFYKTKAGERGVGYDALLLPQVAEVYLRFRDEMLRERGEVPKQYEHIVHAADILMRGLANVGIIALVDEATGYQRERARHELEKILEAFIDKELRPWLHMFPDEFYEHLFRLRGLKYPTDTVARPQYFGHLTNDIIYRRLAPGVLEELKNVTPRDEKGRHKHQLHRRLTADVGNIKLREHIASVITIMKLSNDYNQFKTSLDRIHQRYGDTGMLPFSDSGKGF